MSDYAIPYLTGTIHKLFLNGFGTINLNGNADPFLVNTVLEGWKRFRGLQDWQKEYMSFNMDSVEGSPGYYLEQKHSPTKEHLYINKHLGPYLSRYEVEYDADFFAQALTLKESCYDIAKTVCTKLDEDMRLGNPCCVSELEKVKDSSCLRFSSAAESLSEMTDPLWKSHFFIALQFYVSRNELKFFSYLGAKAHQKNQVLQTKSGNLFLNKSETILPIRCYF